MHATQPLRMSVFKPDLRSAVETTTFIWQQLGWVLVLLHSVADIADAAGHILYDNCARNIVEVVANTTGYAFLNNKSVLHSAVSTALEAGACKWQNGEVAQSPPHITLSTRPPKHHVPTKVVLAIVLPIAFAATAMCIAATPLMRRWERSCQLRSKTVRRVRFLSRQKAPSAGAETTLVITDIQSSTTLWEILPDKIMDTAVKAHHKCIRKLLRPHDGYESATEGDSFILAFHNAQNAVEFCLEAQSALLQVDWPAELLEVELCKPFYVKSVERATEHSPAARTAMQRYGTILASMPSLAVQSTQQPTESRGTVNPSNQSTSTAPGGLFASILNNKNPWAAKGLGLIPRFYAGRSARTPPPNTKAGSCDFGEGSEVTVDQDTFSISSDNKRTWTYKEACKLGWVEAAPTDLGTVMVFRGLRVRMGVHNKVESVAGAHGRVTYAGTGLEMTKAVADAGQGGMVTMSGLTYEGLPMEEMWEKVVVLHAGEHQLKPDIKESLEIYQIFDRRLQGRIHNLEAVKSAAQLSMGVDSAPLGSVTIVFLYLVGTQTLIAWNSAIFEESFRMFCEAAKLELKDSHGYQVELDRGLVLASFSSPKNAVLWCLDLQSRLLDIDWPEELLSHELCEEMLYPSPFGQRIMFRGLRVKAGIDYGTARGSVHSITGRITYRGKVMNRAARIASAATSGQILCSAEVWLHAHETAANELRRVEGNSLGLFRLKGIAERMELVHCRYRAPKGRSVRMSGVILANVDEYINPVEMRQSNASIIDSIRGLDRNVSFHSNSISSENISFPQIPLPPWPGLYNTPSMKSTTPHGKASFRRVESLTLPRSIHHQFSMDTNCSSISTIANEVFIEMEKGTKEHQLASNEDSGERVAPSQSLMATDIILTLTLPSTELEHTSANETDQKPRCWGETPSLISSDPGGERILQGCSPSSGNTAEFTWLAVPEEDAFK